MAEERAAPGVGREVIRPVARMARSGGATASSISSNVPAMRASAARKRSAAERSWMSVVVVGRMRLASGNPFVPVAEAVRAWSGAPMVERRRADRAGKQALPRRGVRRARPTASPPGAGRITPTPIPQAPLTSTDTSMRSGTKPPATGWPLSGAATNQPTTAASSPRPRPSSHIGARGSRGRASPKPRPYRLPQKHRLAINGTPKGGTGLVG